MITHLAKAISIRDFREQVQKRCPSVTPIPCDEWLQLQFWPKIPKTRAALSHTGRLKVQYMVQAKQFRKSHPDEHYAAALFRYMREFAVKFKTVTEMVCLDDKHRMKVGEPGYPVAAVERGRRVIVKMGTSFEVADHDFTKFSLIPSVVLQNAIPDDITGSWYQGKVFVTLKEATFEASSPMRHMAELSAILDSLSCDKKILMIYTDDGPDHRVTYLSVQVTLIAAFMKLEARTAPCQSWRNPVERIMSTLNLGLQTVGLMRREGSEDFEEVQQSKRLTSNGW